MPSWSALLPFWKGGRWAPGCYATHSRDKMLRMGQENVKWRLLAALLRWAYDG